MAATTDKTWPLGQFIRDGRKRAGLSIREAAQRADLSHGAWGMLESGKRSVGGGRHESVVPPPRQIITAAGVVGVDPPRALRLAGYDPAVTAPDLEAGPTITQSELAEKVARLTAAQRAAVMATIEAMLDPSRDVNPDQRHGILFEGPIDEDIPVEQSAAERAHREANHA